jgi:hypothetical protein
MSDVQRTRALNILASISPTDRRKALSVLFDLGERVSPGELPGLTPRELDERIDAMTTKHIRLVAEALNRPDLAQLPIVEATALLTELNTWSLTDNGY